MNLQFRFGECRIFFHMFAIEAREERRKKMTNCEWKTLHGMHGIELAAPILNTKE